MKSYVKVVEAVQYLGDVKVLKEVLKKGDVVIESDTEVYVSKQEGSTGAGYWRLKEGNYVTKENGTITVYSEKRFLEDFDEVTVEDIEVIAPEVIAPVLKKVAKDKKKD